MQFTIPQFIEMEPKIIGPFTFKQFIFIGTAAAIVFILYFSLAETNFFLFLLISSILMLGGFALAFMKIAGKPLPVVLKNFFFFSISKKVYLFKMQVLPQKLISKKVAPKPKEKIEEDPTLKINAKGRLQRLSTQIEIGTK